MVLSTVKLLHREKEGKFNGDQEGCRLGLKPAPDESCKVHRVHMKLGGKLLNSLRIEIQSLKGFRVWVL